MLLLRNLVYNSQADIQAVLLWSGDALLAAVRDALQRGQAQPMVSERGKRGAGGWALWAAEAAHVATGAPSHLPRSLPLFAAPSSYFPALRALQLKQHAMLGDVISMASSPRPPPLSLLPPMQLKQHAMYVVVNMASSTSGHKAAVMASGWPQLLVDQLG